LTGSDDTRLLRDPDTGRPIGYRTQQEAEIAV
jgi:hypothetical protein